MTIEFNTPESKVKEWVISYVEEKLMEFHRRIKELTRAEVSFKENDETGRSCTINLTIFGDSIFVTGSDKSFELASRKAIETLETKLDTLIKKQAEPPDEITSTVKI